ncbi:hypothetical protein ACN47E_000066 [Coniothyrium glycines]
MDGITRAFLITRSYHIRSAQRAYSKAILSSYKFMLPKAYGDLAAACLLAVFKRLDARDWHLTPINRSRSPVTKGSYGSHT